MLNIFNRGKKSSSPAKTAVEKINESALALIVSANETQRGGRLVTKGAALEIVRRSLVKNRDATFSVKKFHALKDVSEYVSLAQRNKVITASAAHFDLLPVGHPSSARSHSMSDEDVMRSRARWYADDSIVTDEVVYSLLAAAFVSDSSSPEYIYAAARLAAMGASRVPIDALVAALGFNDGANRGFWRRQLRDPKGRWARMFGLIKTLVDVGGQVRPQYTKIVSADPNTNRVRSMQPDGRIIDSPVESIDADVKAVIPGDESPDGIASSPARFETGDPITSVADLVYVDEPHGFSRKGAPSSPEGLDVDKFERVWEDELGNYQVIQGNFREGEGSEFVVSRLEQEQVVPIGVGKNWFDAAKIVSADELNFQKGDDAEPNIPEGFDIGPGAREDINPADLSSDELAAGYGWTKSDGRYNRDGFDIEEMPDGKWLLTETGEGGESRESGPFDGPADAFEQGQIDSDGPEFDPGAVVDFRNDQAPPETPEPVAPQGEGFYDVDRGPYEPKGPGDGAESEDYTDDPTEIAQRFESSDLESALEESVRNGSGEGLLPFQEGDEYVPAEAMYNALKEQDRDPDALLDDIYSGDVAVPDQVDLPGDVQDSVEDQGPITAEQVAELRSEQDLPALLDGLNDEELADVINNKDYSPYLPGNDEFDVPEGMYEIDSNPFDPNADIAPDDAPEGAPNNPYDMAMDMSTEDLENGLRGAIAVDEDSDRLGYYPIVAFDEDGEEYSYDAPAEAFRDALQLQGVDTNEILREAYSDTEPTPDEAAEMLDGENIEETDSGGEPGAADGDAGGQGQRGEGVPEPDVDGRGNQDGESPWSSLGNPLPEAASAQDIRDRDLPTPEIFELDPETDADAFEAQMQGLKKNNDYAASVFVYEPEEYREMRLFSTEDGTAGFALKPSGDIVSVYVYGNSPHKKATASMLAQAVELGGDRLDAYDTVLPKIYAEAGFKPISRVTWNDAFAPEGWDKKTYAKFNEGEPDVVAMAYDPDRLGSKYDPTEGEVFADYDEAMAARDASIDGPDGVAESPLGRTYDISDWEQVGGQSGSNQGGLYRDADGNEYYVKFPPQKQLRNELLASALYEKVGVPVGRVYLGRDADGKEVLVSPMLKNSESLQDNLDNPDAIEGARLDFAADAWLNNWDSVGLVFDNMVMADENVAGVGRQLYRIDAGGSLLFRAQGGDKDLPEDVKLIDTLRNPDMNQQAATIYGDMTDEDIKFSVQRMLPGATDANIDELVDSAFPDDTETADLLKERLKSRRDYLIERFKPLTPEALDNAVAGEEETVRFDSSPELDNAVAGEEQAYSEQLKEAQENVDESFADSPLVLDFDGDVEAQVNDAIENQRDLVFSYNGVDRIVRPVSVETNENTGNTNISAVDGDGNFKKFTISKMSSAQDSDNTVGDIVGEDSGGDEIETSDAVGAGYEAIKSQYSAEEQEVLDKIFSTKDATSEELESFGEESDVNDDITTDYVQKIDSYDSDAPVVSTPEQKVMADAVEELINPEEGAQAAEANAAEIAALYDKLVNGINSPDNTESDIIWQRVQDEYEGTLLPNGHIVVSSTMHGDRRYDVVVRRNNDNTFHIYHRVTYPDGSTKVKEMGGQGWHSAEALFSRVDNQIFNSKSRPKTTVNKGLKQENDNTLYADTSTPTQPGSYVAADGSVVKKGDRITVVNPTHSKFGVGGRIVSTKRKYSSDGKKYTDYLRVRYDDGTKNNIVSTSVVPEGNATPAPSTSSKTPKKPAVKTPVTSPAKTKSGAPILPPPLGTKPFGPTVTAANAVPGDRLDLKESLALPLGSVVRSGEGRFYSLFNSENNVWVDISNDFTHNLTESDRAVYIAPNKDAALNEVGPEVENPLESGALPAPSSWTVATTNAEGDALDEFTLPSGDLVVDARLYMHKKNRHYLNKDFAKQYGFDGTGKLQAGLQKLFTSQKKPTKVPSTGLVEIVPGFIVMDASLPSTVADMSKTQYIVDDVDFNTGEFSVVAITGPDRTKRFVGLSGKDVMATSGFLSPLDADTRFGVKIADKPMREIKEAKLFIENPGFYSDANMVNGAGVDEPELESLPDWGQAPEGTVSTEDALNQLRQWDSLGDARQTTQGIYTLMDSVSIEDGQVRIQRVVDADGNKRVRLTGKLTSWFGRNKFISDVDSGKISAKESAGIDFNFYEQTDDGLSYSATPVGGFEIDDAQTGATYSYKTSQGYDVAVHRALTAEETLGLSENEKELDYFSTHESGYDRSVSLHNMFDVLLPENASSSDIEQALQEMGITQSRPATDLDVRTIMENKLITLFGQKRDGTKNASGLLREQELQKIKETYNITVDDLIIESDKTTRSRPIIKLSPEAAKNVVESSGIKHFYHQMGTSSLLGNLDDTANAIVDLFEDGALASSTSRLITGGNTGQSSNDDIFRPGADYTFLYLVNDSNAKDAGHWNADPTYVSSVSFIIDPQAMLERLDFYANEGDLWGMMQNKVFDPLKALEGANSSAEALFKTDVPLSAIKAMSVTPELRARVLKILAERGIDFINGNDVQQMMSTPASDWDWSRK
jgi:hypothetical protein